MSHSKRNIGTLLAILLVASAAFSAAADVSLELMFRDMDPHLGQGFFLRVVNTRSREELARLSVAEIPGGSFDLEVSGLVVGASYQVDFFADVNGNGLYDAPPADHAWRIELPNVQSDGSLTFTHHALFEDIGWPPVIDGVIAEDEYGNELFDSETGMTVYWYNHDAFLYIGLAAPGTGWLSIGFGPERQMQGANIIIASIEDAVLTIEDHYGSTPTAHRIDDADHILQAAATEAAGESILEFVIPLDSGDDQDRALTAGSEVTVILGYHSSNDSLSARHSARSTTAIVLDN